MGRRPRSHLDLVRPNLVQQVQSKQLTQQANRGGTAERQFSVGDSVFAKNFASGQKWLLGTVVKLSGPRSYLIELLDNRTIRRHIDHVRARSADLPTELDESTEDWVNEGPQTPPQPPAPNVEAPNTDGTVQVRRSTRPSQPPNRFGF